MHSVQVFRFIAIARWIAAFAVLITHATNLFINQSDIMVAPHGPGPYVWWFLQGFAHQAVIVFFVMSGFLVGGNVIERSRRSEPFHMKYFTDRVVRIYLVLVPVLLLGWCLDTIGQKVFAGGVGFYKPPYFQSLGVDLLGLNLLNLQGIYAPSFGTNGALWSLGCEFWYYMIFPLLLLPLTRAAPLLRVLGFGCGAALAVTFSRSTASTGFFLLGGLIWISGALVRVLPRPLIRSKFVALLMFLTVTVAVRLIMHGKLLTIALWTTAADIAVALSFCNLLLSLRHTQSREWALCRWRIHERLSDFSYSLYACHLPLAIFMASSVDYFVGFEWRMRLPTALNWIVLAAVLGLILCSAWLLSRITEARTADVRHLAYRLVEAMRRREVGAMALAEEAVSEPEPVSANAA